MWGEVAGGVAGVAGVMVAGYFAVKRDNRAAITQADTQGEERGRIASCLTHIKDRVDELVGTVTKIHDDMHHHEVRGQETRTELKGVNEQLGRHLEESGRMGSRLKKVEVGMAALTRTANGRKRKAA